MEPWAEVAWCFGRCWWNGTGWRVPRVPSSDLTWAPAPPSWDPFWEATQLQAGGLVLPMKCSAIAYIGELTWEPYFAAFGGLPSGRLCGRGALPPLPCMLGLLMPECTRTFRGDLKCDVFCSWWNLPVEFSTLRPVDWVASTSLLSLLSFWLTRFLFAKTEA